MAVTPDNLDLGRGGEGLTEQVIRDLSWMRGEPEWVLDLRLAALRRLDHQGGQPRSGDLADIVPSADERDELLAAIEQAKAGVPLAGPTNRADPSSQAGSETALQHDQERLERQGVVVCDLATAVADHPELVRPHLGTMLAIDGDWLSALNASVWSSGSFIYVPPGVQIDVPLQSSLRIDSGIAGPFERTLLVADEGSTVHYIAGCSAPVYTADPLRSAAVEVVVGPSAHVTYTTIQNWSCNVFNLVAKRARVEADGHMSWVDGNFGSRITADRPTTWLAGPRATARALSVAYAGLGQHQHTGATMVHAAPETSSTVLSKLVSTDGGRSSHHGLIRVDGEAGGCTSDLRCDGLVLDDRSIAESHPSTEIGAGDAQVGHEASVSPVAEEQLFYLMSRGLSRQQAVGLVVNGFIEPVTRTLPIEYAVEWTRLVELQMEGSVG